MSIGKKGRIYAKFLIASATLIALAFSLYTLAANPSATPRIVSGQNSTIGENATVAKATKQLFGYATFKWYSRTLYQPQNRSTEVGL